MVKPARGLAGSWLSRLPRQRRMALGSIAALLTLLAALVAYQTYFLPQPEPETASPAPVPDTSDPAPGVPVEAPPATAGAEPPAGVPGPAETAEALGPASLGHPLGGERLILKPFGDSDRVLDDHRFYNAIAFEASEGEAVFAAARGTVASVEEHPVEGLLLLLDHGGGFSTQYAGLAEISVKPGDFVQQGATIGQIGLPTLARSELGPHLAFAVLLDGDPFDPETYLED